MADRVINRDRSVIVAADVEASTFQELIKKTCLVSQIEHHMRYLKKLSS